MTAELAQQAVHDRSTLAFAAARATGLPGTFSADERAGLLVTLATDPQLSYLNLISNVSAETVAGVPAALEMFESVGAPMPSLTVLRDDDAVDAQLRGWGLQVSGHRPLASMDLSLLPSTDGIGVAVDEVDGQHDLDAFLHVLDAGYEAPFAPSRFMAAEHSVDAVRRFVLRQGGKPTAVAAMSVHRGVAVLGGATVLPAWRGRGLQTALLRHRLLVARAIGCVTAAATAAPESGSLVNLIRAGFTIHDRRVWR